MAQGSRTQIWKGPSEVKSTFNNHSPHGELRYQQPLDSPGKQAVLHRQDMAVILHSCRLKEAPEQLILPGIHMQRTALPLLLGARFIPLGYIYLKSLYNQKREVDTSKILFA